MPKNSYSDLNNHLFAQLEKLGDDDIKGDELKEEIDRAKAMSGIAKDIIANGHLALKAIQTAHDCMVSEEDLPVRYAIQDKTTGKK